MAGNILTQAEIKDFWAIPRLEKKPDAKKDHPETAGVVVSEVKAPAPDLQSPLSIRAELKRIDSNLAIPSPPSHQEIDFAAQALRVFQADVKKLQDEATKLFDIQEKKRSVPQTVVDAFQAALIEEAKNKNIESQLQEANRESNKRFLEQETKKREKEVHGVSLQKLLRLINGRVALYFLWSLSDKNYNLSHFKSAQEELKASGMDDVNALDSFKDYLKKLPVNTVHPDYVKVIIEFYQELIKQGVFVGDDLSLATAKVTKIIADFYPKFKGHIDQSPIIATRQDLLKLINERVADYFLKSLGKTHKNKLGDFKAEQRKLTVYGISLPNAMASLNQYLDNLPQEVIYPRYKNTIKDCYQKLVEKKVFAKGNLPKAAQNAIEVITDFHSFIFDSIDNTPISVVEKTLVASFDMKCSDQLSPSQKSEVTDLLDGKRFSSKAIKSISEAKTAFPIIMGLPRVAKFVKEYEEKETSAIKEKDAAEREYSDAAKKAGDAHKEQVKRANSLSDLREVFSAKQKEYESKKQSLELRKAQLKEQLQAAEQSVIRERKETHDRLKDTVCSQVIVAAARYLKHMASGVSLEGWHFNSGRERATQLVNTVMKAETLSDIVTAINAVLNTTRWYGWGAVLGKDSFNTFLLKELSRDGKPCGVFSLKYTNDIDVDFDVGEWRNKIISQDDLRRMNLTHIAEASGEKVRRISEATEDDRIHIRDRVVHELSEMAKTNSLMIPVHLSQAGGSAEKAGGRSRRNSVLTAATALGMCLQTAEERAQKKLEFQKGMDYLDRLGGPHKYDDIPVISRDREYLPVQGTPLGVCKDGKVCKFIFNQSGEEAVGVEYPISQEKIKEILHLSPVQLAAVRSSSPRLISGLSSR